MKGTPTSPDFAGVLLQRVRLYLDDPRRQRRGRMLVYAKALAILLLYGWTYYHYLTAETFAVFLGFSLLMGVCHVLIPLHIVHDATHAVFSPNATLNHLALLSMHLVGSDPILYRKMHLQAHRDKESGSRRKAIETQQLLMQSEKDRKIPVIFYIFYAFYMAFVRDFVLAKQEKTATTAGGWLGLAVPKALHFFAIWILPFLVLPLPAWQILIGIFSIYLLITALLIVLLLMPTDPIEVARNEGGQSLSDAWVQQVLSHNVDFSPDLYGLNFMVAGANMNVIHHLFPEVNHIHYVGLSGIIRETTAEYGLPYREQNIWKVFGIHWRYMMELGQS